MDQNQTNSSTIPVTKAVDGVGKISSVVALVYEAKLAPGTVALFQAWYPKPFPDTLGQAEIDAEKMLVKDFGEVMWRCLLKHGLNLQTAGTVKAEPSVVIIKIRMI